MCAASTRSTLPHYFEDHFRSVVNLDANTVEIDTNECTSRKPKRKLSKLNFSQWNENSVMSLRCDWFRMKKGEHLVHIDDAAKARTFWTAKVRTFRAFSAYHIRPAATESLTKTPFTENNAKNAPHSTLSLSYPAVCGSRICLCWLKFITLFVVIETKATSAESTRPNRINYNLSTACSALHRHSSKSCVAPNVI